MSAPPRERAIDEALELVLGLQGASHRHRYLTPAYAVLVSTVAERLTADDHLAREDPRRTELIGGAVVLNEPMELPHGR